MKLLTLSRGSTSRVGPGVSLRGFAGGCEGILRGAVVGGAGFDECFVGIVIEWWQHLRGGRCSPRWVESSVWIREVVEWWR